LTNGLYLQYTTEGRVNQEGIFGKGAINSPKKARNGLKTGLGYGGTDSSGDGQDGTNSVGRDCLTVEEGLIKLQKMCCCCVLV
jgi:hypothetical protein